MPPTLDMRLNHFISCLLLIVLSLLAGFGSFVSPLLYISNYPQVVYIGDMLNLLCGFSIHTGAVKVVEGTQLVDWDVVGNRDLFSNVRF